MRTHKHNVYTSHCKFIVKSERESLGGKGGLVVSGGEGWVGGEWGEGRVGGEWEERENHTRPPHT